ncbi:hypothetical protein MNBD_GAMMA12-1690 [hydrothermal vent metagenome]|uniref:FtsH ternary system domain-containing protein n=1 Tax=hydrothermal vent metagenome TaxID=652676 RepID=A0A3B0YTT2_9ZZZZ
MNKVAQSEFEMLSLVQGLCTFDQSHLMESLIRESRKLPKKYSSLALSLLGDMLSKGLIIGLVKNSGVGTQVLAAEGKNFWWNNNKVQGLKFSEQSIVILRWVLGSELLREQVSSDIKGTQFESGDRLLMYFVCCNLANFQCDYAIKNSKAFRSNALCWLGYFDYLSQSRALSSEELSRLDFDALMTKDAWLVESLQKMLRNKWLAIEAGKSIIDCAQYMIGLGQTQSLLLEHLFRAAEKHKRLDLLLFVFEVAGQIVSNNPTPKKWIESLPQDISLNEYTEAVKASMSLFTTLESCAQVIHDLKTIRIFDEDYQYSQLVLKHWECYGDSGIDQARRWFNELTAIDQSVESAN